jgi:hypothetical protein
MKIEIELTDADETELIAQVAGENGLTVNQYCTNIVSGWIQNQLRGVYVQYARTAKLSDLKDKIGKIKEK